MRFIHLLAGFMLAAMSLHPFPASTASASAFDDRPVIGVSGQNPPTQSVKSIMQMLRENGAYPVLLPHDLDAVDAHIGMVHGVVMAGNDHDVNPNDYGAMHNVLTRNEDENPAASRRSDYEYALIDQVTKRGVPFLGICGGMQRLNVANHATDGGTLIQHVEGQNQAQITGTYDPFTPIEFIAVKAGTQLATIAGSVKDRVITLEDESLDFNENSLHHQVVETVRHGFRISAHGKESNLIEAIEADPGGPYGAHPFLMGVQWHPEYGVSALSRQLFHHLVDTARDYAKDHPVDPARIGTIGHLGRISEEQERGRDGTGKPRERAPAM